MHNQEFDRADRTVTPLWCLITVAASAMLGLGLIADQSVKLSSTYDEVTYLQVGAHWWRTGEQAEISRMGSPLSSWKIQQAPTLWALDQLGFGAWIDDPVVHQEQLLPVIRIGESWIWVVALLVTALWANRLYGPRGMALAAFLFAISPNLLAHGALSTMELPLIACTSLMFYRFWSFLETGNRRDYWITAALGGLAMSCKFTTVLVPPILGLLWAIDLWRKPVEADSPGPLRRGFGILRTVALGMVPFLAVMVLSNLIVTGFATIPLSARQGSHPFIEGKLPPRIEKFVADQFENSFPQDWVGFGNQFLYQLTGGPSYLLGERRMSGWRHYYLVAMAVKVPLAFWLLFASRLILKRRGGPDRREWVLPVIMIAFLLIAMTGSKRNYGFRYLLPMATPAIVWISAVAEGGRWSRILAGLGLAGMALAVGTSHPHELSYFNELTGGSIGGRRVLSDSNLDWGQGAKALAKLQRSRPEFRDLTVFYFGEIDPGHFGVEGKRFLFRAIKNPEDLPAKLAVDTKYLAVSATLQWGPIGPPGYFSLLDNVEPIAYTDDTTIAIYKAEDLLEAQAQAQAIAKRP